MKKNSNNGRKVFSWANPYHEQIVFLCVSPCIALCLFITTLLFIFFTNLENVLLHKPSSINVLNIHTWGWFIMICSWIFLILSCIWVYRKAYFIVGPFYRVLRELKMIEEGKKKDAIKVRDQDKMFVELIESINRLTSKMNEK